MSTPTSVEQICNDALVRIGYPESIGNIYDGTVQARAALEIYAQTRDVLLREADFDFSEQIVALNASATGPQFPWLFAYDYPADCIKVRALFDVDYEADANDPLPVNWTVINVNGVKEIHANADISKAVITLAVTDVTQWEPAFVEALVTRLAANFPAALDRAQAAQVAEKQADDALITAATVTG